MPKVVGLDIGTNMLVVSTVDAEGNPVSKMQRDAFYHIVPKTDVNRKSIKISLDKRESNYIVNEDGSYIVVGEDALEMAMERNDVAQRPMLKGVISPKEKDALPILKLLIEALIGKGNKGDKCVYSVPAPPIDSSFDVVYHTEIMGRYINKMGYDAKPINEGMAVALSELLDDGLNGVAISLGAGMANISVMHSGESVVNFSLTRGGDYIDNAVGKALDISPSLVQLEKESGIDLLNPTTKIAEAISVYYSTVINYVLRTVVFELEKNSKEFPRFREAVPIVFSGGLSLANGFMTKVNESISDIKFPMKIKEVRLASEPMLAVSNGAYLSGVF